MVYVVQSETVGVDGITTPNEQRAEQRGMGTWKGAREVRASSLADKQFPIPQNMKDAACEWLS